MRQDRRFYATAYFLPPRVKVGSRIGAMALVHRKLPKRGQVSTGTSGYELDNSASVRPICTLQHAGVSGGIREPLVGTVGNIDHGSRANGLRADGVEQVSRNLVSYHKSSASL